MICDNLENKRIFLSIGLASFKAEFEMCWLLLALFDKVVQGRDELRKEGLQTDPDRQQEPRFSGTSRVGK